MQFEADIFFFIVAEDLAPSTVSTEGARRA